MRDDRPSTTAALVAAARAIVHDSQSIPGFSDPYARKLLPHSYGTAAARAMQWVSRDGAHILGLRTVAIDEGIRTAPDLSQVVILGAGLDARAWRMPQLESVPVFEVDHPSTQRYKRERTAEFPRRELHTFVGVDFEHDSLDERLEQAGHRTDQPTVWVWEGVTMYLWPEAIEATLGVVAKRSAPGSRLLVTYQPKSLPKTTIGLLTRILGEPFRSSHTPEEMADLLRRHGFVVTSDECAIDWQPRWVNPGQSLLDRMFADVERLASADLH